MGPSHRADCWSHRQPVRFRVISRLAQPLRIRLCTWSHESTPLVDARLKDGLGEVVARFLHSGTGAVSPSAAADFSDRIFELLIDAYLDARPEPMPKSGRVRNASRIVRAAEERFARAGQNAVSLADLCAAASVGKTALYVAFESYCGEPPIAYFHKRRLATARTRLLESVPKSGVVTRVALSAGLTELGRFARDYRRLFGESPSVTLKRPAP